jgi:hypothetical protein
MITRSGPPRAAAKWVVVTTAIVALGCPPPSGFPPPIPDWSTPLPTGVDSNAGTFRAVLKGFPRSSTSHMRARAATCRPGSLDSRGHPRILCAVDVMIEPVGNTMLIDPENAPATGAPVARIENLDSVDTEARFGFRPGIQALYYLWVDRKPGSTKARWTILQVPISAGIVTAGYQADLRRCHVYTPTSSDADFVEYKDYGRGCDSLATAEKPSISQASLISTKQFAALVGRVAAFLRGELTAAQGGWISCSGGCCT